MLELRDNGLIFEVGPERPWDFSDRCEQSRATHKATLQKELVQLLADVERGDLITKYLAAEASLAEAKTALASAEELKRTGLAQIEAAAANGQDDAALQQQYRDALNNMGGLEATLAGCQVRVTSARDAALRIAVLFSPQLAARHTAAVRDSEASKTELCEKLRTHLLSVLIELEGIEAAKAVAIQWIQSGEVRGTAAFLQPIFGDLSDDEMALLQGACDQAKSA